MRCLAVLSRTLSWPRPLVLPRPSPLRLVIGRHRADLPPPGPRAAAAGAIDAILDHQRGEDALAQAPVGNAQPLAGPHLQHGLEDGAAGEHQVGALPADAGLAPRAPRSSRPSSSAVTARTSASSPASSRRRGCARTRQARCTPATVVTVPEVPSMCVEPPARRSFNLCSASKGVSMLRDVGRPWRRTCRASTKRPPKRSASVTTPTGSDVQAPMQFCTSMRSESERRHVVLAPRQIEEDELGGAAADVEHQRIVAAEIDERGAARDGELGLRLPADDLDVEPGLVARPLQELAAVGGEPAGLGGDQPRALDLVRARSCRHTPSAPRSCARWRPPTGGRSWIRPRPAG